jgi:RNA polymerase sigma-70 factor (ECF subfamily)
MRGVLDSTTSPTLLGRLRQCPADQVAWSAFVRRYRPRILAWCRHWGLQDADAHDVAQIVLVRIVQRMQTFVYDPSRSFRAWLKTLAHHAWRDFVEDRRRAVQGNGGNMGAGALEVAEARDDLLARLAAAFDLELREQAMDSVRLRVEACTWEAFRLLVEEDLSGAEVASRLNMKVADVYLAKSRVIRMLRETVQKLDRTAEEEGEPRE